MRNRCALFLLTIFSLMAPMAAVAQGNNITVNVAASIQTAVELITISNMNFGRINLDATEIRLDPRVDAGAGLMKATGRPNALIRISFLEERSLTRVGGGQPLNFTYIVAGSTTDSQLNSELLTRENRTMAFSSTGEYFFWIGGFAAIDNIEFGSYQGEFTIEVEYL